MSEMQSDWRRARAERRACERRLPPGLAHELKAIRRSDLGHDLAQEILDDAAAIAARQGDLIRVVPAASPPWSYVRPAAEREILRRLERNPAYRRQVRARIRSTLRTEHVVKIDPRGDPLQVPSALPIAPIARRTLVVQSSIGLGTASVLEGPPEAWDQWAAAAIVDAATDDELSDFGLGLEAVRCLRVLVVGALGGGFARAVTAVGSTGLAVTELDWVLPQPTNLPCVEGRGLAAPMGTFAAAVAVFPSPAVSAAANQRKIYRSNCADDPARLGPRRWAQAVVGYLGLVNAALDVGGLAYVLLPLGVRHQRGFEAAPHLLDDVLLRIPECGFQILANLPTVEVEPVAQPFVGTQRPSKVTFILKKTANVEIR